ncbi:hypothetical protein JIN77_01445 [Verrucomicrobiaceae bacterium R5-34]|uniref:Uncharacterized protein n=1 Tax=Oceaniferula flava TaxID=2800421 RepID=A0AAE2VCR8_9BACT|nr:hypothetical protein [Oceaniferula flavus]MBK1829376.1 hypothetical protein [Verrucomicrobiaceae bacterium R5-34]MBK1853604.1 hypothetical protein [Oceaniferula flavus]MBM1134909.1 hypothetical protein [Oceaniferula flavus]
MIKIHALVLLLTLCSAQAREIPYDFVTYDTVRQYVKEHPVEYDTWLRVYVYKVKSGAGVTHPRKGAIYSNKDESQQLANMLSFYAEVRENKGQSLHSVTDKFIVFNFHKKNTQAQPPIYRTRP